MGIIVLYDNHNTPTSDFLCRDRTLPSRRYRETQTQTEDVGNDNGRNGVVRNDDIVDSHRHSRNHTRRRGIRRGKLLLFSVVYGRLCDGYLHLVDPRLEET
mmetsp:Transcript_36757/g.40591  ORF Transcript_36757/g.40591 Transcript_36757/m.40591 type:complete len:101 (+) Transcript_36757:190-492(+)